MSKAYLRTDLALISTWIPENAHILDLGCGKGDLLKYLHTKANITGYGLEINIQNISKGIDSGVNIIHQNLNHGLQNFPDNSFDYVVMTQTLQAIKKPAYLLSEMLRVGKQSIITFPNFAHWSHRLYLSVIGKMPVSRSLPNPWYDTPNIHLCTIKDFELLCKEENIQILQRAIVNTEHRSTMGNQIFPNFFGEIALYRLQQKNT